MAKEQEERKRRKAEKKQKKVGEAAKKFPPLIARQLRGGRGVKDRPLRKKNLLKRFFFIYSL